MENADHVDLAGWLRTHGAMPPAAAVVMIGQLADALDAAHTGGEVHGDVSTSTVALVGVDAARPDVSELRASFTGSGAETGSDARADVAGLGRVLRDALTGTPTAGRRDTDTDTDARRAAPPFGPDVPAGLREVVARATSPDPAVRYDRAGDLAGAARAATGRPEVASGPPGGAAGTLVRPIGAPEETSTRPTEQEAPPAGTLVRPLTPTTDVNSTLDRPIAATSDAQGTPARPIGSPTTPGPAREPVEGAASGPAPGWTRTVASAPSSRRTGKPVVLAVALLGVLLVGAVAYIALQPTDLRVLDASVVPTTSGSASCDTTVDLLGTIRTNGQAGTITYSWLRSDGSETGARTQRVDDGADSVDVHLLWQISGKGHFPATATLRVIEPTANEAQAEFVYDCR